MTNMMSIVVNNESDISVNFDVERFLATVIRDQGIEVGIFEVSFVTPDTIVSINQAHLGRDYVTDSITYNLGAEGDPIESDIYICLDQVQDNAEALGNPFEFELKIVMIHCILHCLGYEDYTPESRAQMDRLQLEIIHRIEEENRWN
ncbi:rRNA maturation RNase YbeY [bacterium]|nr:rRNA maturation RNase YbeY [bacterium]